MKIKTEGFRTALTFVVAGSRAGRVNVAEVLLPLRVFMGVTVHLTGGGLEQAGVIGNRQFQQVEYAVSASLEGLNRVHLILDWGGHTGEVVDLVNLDQL